MPLVKPTGIRFTETVRAFPRTYARALGMNYPPPNAPPAHWLRPWMSKPPAIWHREVWEAWVESPISADWTAGYFLTVQGGRPVVGEVRIYPTEPHPAREVGTWSGHVLGAKARVPAGGLKAAHLKKLRIWPRFRLDLDKRKAVDYQLHRDVWVPLFLPAPGPPAKLRTGTPTAKRGRPRRPDADFIPAAVVYASKFAAGERRPIAAAARALKLPATRVRELIAQARRRGLLEWGLLDRGGQGIAGGHLTPKGKRLQRLLAQRRRKR